MDVYTDHLGNKSEINTSLKTIDANFENIVSDNCFGYSVALSNFRVKLKAIAKMPSFCYFIDKEAFSNCCRETIVDL